MPLLQLSHKEDTVLGFRVHRMLKAEFLQAAQVTVYDYYEPCEQGPGNGGDPQDVQGLRRMGPGNKTEGRGAPSQNTKWGVAERGFFGSVGGLARRVREGT